MNAIDGRLDTRFPTALPDFLEALSRLYRCIGLTPENARAATLADAESFAPEPVEPAVAP